MLALQSKSDIFYFSVNACVWVGDKPPIWGGHYTATRDRSWCIYRQKHKHTDKSDNVREGNAECPFPFSIERESLCIIKEKTYMYVWIVILTPHSPTPLWDKISGKEVSEGYGVVGGWVGGWTIILTRFEEGSYDEKSSQRFVNSFTGSVSLESYTYARHNCGTVPIELAMFLHLLKMDKLTLPIVFTWF